MTAVDMSWPVIEARIKGTRTPRPPRDRIAYAVPNTPGEWTDHAACKGRGDLFYTTATEDMAKDICRGCPVQSACLDHALTHRELGVWGATTAQQRDQIRRRRIPNRA